MTCQLVDSYQGLTADLLLSGDQSTKKPIGFQRFVAKYIIRYLGQQQSAFVSKTR